jgi:hypothetical protein
MKRGLPRNKVVARWRSKDTGELINDLYNQAYGEN